MSTDITTVLITGASSGMGLDAAKAFANRGSNLVLNARNAERLAEVVKTFADQTKVAVVPGDIGKKETSEQMVKVAVERFEGVNVLINNAGIFAPKAFEEVTEEDLDNCYQINLKGAYFASQAATRQMKKQDGGSIINVGTVLVNHAMAGLPAELAHLNIRVNTVAPGVIRTPIHGDANPDDFAGIHLLKRIGEVKDTSDAFVYLATANNVTGVILPIDGGYAAGRL